ncbi:MAG TPA: cell division protein FtsL [Candidatus Eisenbacteria bacterium]|nr:cell division protein FtsL [Candidatus Eisenbacteria bacterium]
MATAFRWWEIPDGETAPKEPRIVRGQGKATQQLRPAPGRFGMREGRGLAPRRTRAPLVEFHTLKRIDNSRLVRHVEPLRLRAYYKLAALGGAVAMCFMFYIYQHFRCIDLSFQLEDLRGKQTQAQALNSQLKLEMESWRNPHRINAIAQQLGLEQPAPQQVLEYSDFDSTQAESARLVRPNRNP